MNFDKLNKLKHDLKRPTKLGPHQFSEKERSVKRESEHEPDKDEASMEGYISMEKQLLFSCTIKLKRSLI